MTLFTSGSLLSTVALSLALGLLYVVGVITYRLTLHPLAKYPGPLLGRITDWYSVIRSARGDRHLHFHQLHEKHGTFVRFGPNRVAVNTPEALKNIYGARANTNKSSNYSVSQAVYGGGSSSVTTIDAEAHVRKKRIVSGALSERSMRGMEELMVRDMGRFVAAVGPAPAEEWSSPKNMADWCGYLSFDVMGHVCFSCSFDMLLKEDNRFVLDVLIRGVNGINMAGWMPAIVKLGMGTKLLFAKLLGDMRRYQDFANKQSAKRIALGSDAVHADVYSHLLASMNPKDPIFTPADLVREAAVLITAGSHTTAVAMAATIFYLVHNPSSLSRLESEILGANFAREDDIRSASTDELRYLHACIDEAMRMAPSVPGLLPRVALHGGVTIGGEHFPPGTDLGVCHYALNHNEAVYPDPFAYLPERWLPEPIMTTSREPETEEQAETRLRTAQSGYCAFSIGPRACVGKAFAWKELTVALARLVWTYEMRLAQGHEHVGAGGGADMGRHRVHEYQLRDMLIAKTDGPVVQFRRRNPRQPADSERGFH